MGSACTSAPLKKEKPETLKAQIEKYLLDPKKPQIVPSGRMQYDPKHPEQKPLNDPSTAKNFYEGIRLAERENYTETLVHCSSTVKRNEALFNRLKQLAKV